MSEDLRVELERSGGFAGMTLRGVLDTAALPPDDARRLRRLVDGVDWPALDVATRKPVRAPDRFSYTLVVRRGSASHQLRLGEGQVSPALRPLLDLLLDAAKGG